MFYVAVRLVYSLSLTVTLILTLFMTSVGHQHHVDVTRRLVTSLDRHDVMTRLTQDAADAMARVERSLLSNASKQRDVWRHDVTACQRHVSQLTAHVSQLTSGDSWRCLDTNKLLGSLTHFLRIHVEFIPSNKDLQLDGCYDSVDYYVFAYMFDATVILTLDLLTQNLTYSSLPQSLLVVKVWSDAVNEYSRYRGNSVSGQTHGHADRRTNNPET